ncbi:Response regulator ArlR [Phycisphaerae bacterium RAS1]|nr:Response regulator ArlR [Phycisphaerae bacterium RAS1]
MPEKKRILLVDDDRDIARGVAIRLRAEGFDVTVTYDGEEGLSAALEAAPDAIVLDMRMPVVDGLTVLRKLREHPETIDIPVVVLSASVVEKGRVEALNLGARYFLEKPFDAPRLIDAIRAVLPSEGECSTAAAARLCETRSGD